MEITEVVGALLHILAKADTEWHETRTVILAQAHTFQRPLGFLFLGSLAS